MTTEQFSNFVLFVVVGIPVLALIIRPIAKAQEEKLTRDLIAMGIAEPWKHRDAARAERKRKRLDRDQTGGV